MSHPGSDARIRAEPPAVAGAYAIWFDLATVDGPSRTGRLEPMDPGAGDHAERDDAPPGTGESDDGYRCSTGNWVPLNGPGADGGWMDERYSAPCPSDIHCIQGWTGRHGREVANNNDAAVAVKYINDGYDVLTTALTWSGSSGGSSRSPVASACASRTLGRASTVRQSRRRR